MTTIPTIASLYTGIKSDLETELNVSIPLIGRVMLRAIAAVQAAKLKMVYLFLAKVQKNIAPDLADSELLGGTLERWGRILLGRNPFSAVAGEYTITVTGTIGATIPANTTFKSDDDAQNPGALFILDSAFVMTATTDTITVRALTAGTETAMSVGEGLTATAPIPNVDREAVIASITTNPQPAESLALYRSRTVEAFWLEPQGGAQGDYRLWSADAQGVQKVYPYTATVAVNQVDLYVEATPADSVPVDSGIPTAAILSAVNDVILLDPDTSLPINERGRKPVTVTLNVQPISPLNVDIEITNYLGLTPSIQTTIVAALESHIASIRPFVTGADIEADRNDRISEISIINAIQTAVPGGFFDSLELTVDSNVVTDHQFLLGEIPLSNTITFV